MFLTLESMAELNPMIPSLNYFIFVVSQWYVLLPLIDITLVIILILL